MILDSYYQGALNKPAHLSVGAIVYNKEDETFGYLLKKLDGYSIHNLMTKTVMPGETMEETLERGLLSEMGAKGDIMTYIGSLQSTDTWWADIGKPTEVEKTTVFFLIELTNYAESDRDQKDASEGTSEVGFKSYEDLYTAFEQEYEKYKHDFFNFAPLLKRSQEYIQE